MNDATRPIEAAASAFPLPPAKPSELGFHEPALARLRKLIQSHIEAGSYPGAQIALARHGRLALYETFGRASIAPDVTARDDTLWLLFSNTKVVTAVGIWVLIEDGLLRFSDRISQHVPEFARNGKGEITLAQVLSHRGGFPRPERRSNAGPTTPSCAGRCATSPSSGPRARACNITRVQRMRPVRC